MTPEVAYILDHVWGIAGTLLGALIINRQNRNKKTIVIEITNALHNGAGEVIARKTVEQIKPVLIEAAAGVVEQVGQQQEIVARALAEKGSEGWDGTDRRTGVADRRTGPADRRGTE
ncbi:MAG TPA: hypothetical protein VNU68_35165 [Verrucomicrobiae bacterium]|nr:hypothetical protein [Verrucomicrobiae bacterium]